MPKGTAHKAYKLFDLIAAIGHTATTLTGTGIDCKGFEEALILLSVGLMPSTDGTIAIHLEESDALGSGYADITGAAFAVLNAGESLSYVGRMNLKNRKRYIRAVSVVGVQTCPLYLGALLSEARAEPVTQINAVAFDIT
jgi:hypothetical protein